MHDKDTIHGNDGRGRTAKKGARQWPNTPRGKDSVHGEGIGHCRALPFAVRAAGLHGKVDFA
jgi:hypothetical protein